MIQNPHDALFKSVLGQPAHARGVLFKIVPASVAGAINWSELALQPGSFVDLVQPSRHTDLLYTVTWRGRGGPPLYLLFEHQSTPPTEGLMAHRLLRYMGRIWERWRQDHPGDKTLPTIIPIVLYHGAPAWLEPQAFDALLEVPPDARAAVAPYLVRFEYLLHDLSAISDEALQAGSQQTALARLVLLCFKHAQDGAGLLEGLRRWMAVAREVAQAPDGLEALAQVIRYIVEVAEQIEAAALQELLDREIGPEAKDTIMTIAQRYIEQGIEQGRQQERQALFLRFLQKRFGLTMAPGIEERVARASREEVETWLDRVLAAATLDEVFAG